MTLRPLFLPFLAVASLGQLAAQGFGPMAEPPQQPGNGLFGPVTPQTGRPSNGRTVIESDNGASFDNADSSADFIGHVVVHDPQFDLSCDRLHVILRPDRKGLQKVVAIGNVVVTQEKRNDRGDVVKSIGKCGKATYETASGDVTLEEWPQIQQGINNQIATQQNTIMILNAKGRSRTIGGSRTMIVDTGGDKAVTP
jgi:lipopolysaccharide export system protein LptA